MTWFNHPQHFRFPNARRSPPLHAYLGAMPVSLDNLKISRKLIIAFALLIATSVVSSALIFVGHNDLDAKITQVDGVNERTLMLATGYTQLVEQQNVMRGFALDGDEGRLEDAARYAAAFDERITAYRDATLIPEQRERADRMIAMVSELRTTVDHGIELARNPATRDEAQALFARTKLTDIRTLVNEMLAVQEEALVTRGADQEAALNMTDIILLVGGVLTVLISIGMGILLARSIATPVTQMTATMGKLAAGDNNVDIPAPAGRTKSATWPPPFRASRTPRSRRSAWSVKPPPNAPPPKPSAPATKKRRRSPPPSKPLLSTASPMA
jgi:CHASE3 domain sensor protein